MKIDVSEVKCFRECKRKWAFNSRNSWHLRSQAHMPALAFGTLFHECLASLYLGASLESVLETVNRELSDPAELRTMTSMLSGYYEQVLKLDLQEYIVKDIEHKFTLDIPPFNALGIELCGSIDMVAVTPKGEVWGFEHKTCSRFRDPLYTTIDEQPRLYTVALNLYIAELNLEWAKKHEGEADHYKLGGIYLNEVRKVQRTFDTKRTVCKYSEEDLKKFMLGFYMTCEHIKELSGKGVPDPEPGYMRCNMCDFKYLCEQYMYTEPVLEDVLDEFSEEFRVCTTDHLDEKLERKNTDDANT